MMAYNEDGTKMLHVMRAGEGYLAQVPAKVHLRSRPKKVEVHWPDGRQSEHQVSTNSHSMVELTHPDIRPGPR